MSAVSIHDIGQAVGSYVAKRTTKFDQAEFLAYGAEILLGSIVKLSILFLAAVMLGIIPEVITLLVVAGLVRTFSGGAHCSAYYRCLVTSVSIFIAVGYSIKNVYPFISLLPSIVLVAITVISLYLYWCYAPQAPPDKPFESRTMELTFRRYTLAAAVVLTIVSIILGTNSSIGWTIALALLWQAFTLTPAGHRVIGSLDNLLTLKEKGGEAGC